MARLPIKMRYCFNCGEELGMMTSSQYDPFDTCGKSACEREARYTMESDRADAHEQLDRDRGW